MDDSYYFMYNEEETEKVKEIKLELHKALKKNRERVKQVNKPMEASNVISLIDEKSKLKDKNDKNSLYYSKSNYDKNSLNKNKDELPIYSDNRDSKKIYSKEGEKHYEDIYFNERKKQKLKDKDRKNDKNIKVYMKQNNNDNKNENKHIVEKKKRKISSDNTPNSKLKTLPYSNKEKKKIKTPSYEVINEKSVISINSKESISHLSISSKSSSSTNSSSTNYLSYDKKKENSSNKNLISGNTTSIKKDSIYSKNKNISTEKYIRKEKNNIKEINSTKSRIFKDLNDFKINYQNLTNEEKEYYNYMMKKLNIKYDSKKHIFYSDGIFIENFAKMTEKENGKFNYIGYLEYASFYILEWLTPTKEEKLLKLKSLLKLELIVKSIFPKSKMEVFGSFVTGLSIPGSDVDVCFMNVDGEDINCLYIIAYALIKLNIYSDIKIVKDAKVKILKYTDRESGVQIDICINQKSSRETTEFILKQIKEYIYLRPLVLLLKFFLNSRNLNETYTGGIGSFLLCCMVLHFLQLHPSTFDNYTYNNTYLVKLLIEFFNFYSIDYNLNDNCSIMRGLGHIMPRMLRKEFEGCDRICFENPIDTSLDIGRNAYKIKYILYLFSYTFCSLLSLVSKLKREKSLFIKNKENEHINNNSSDNNNFVEGSKINTNSLYPLFFGHLINPDNIVFTKRIKENFPSEDWNISHFDFTYSKQEKNNLFEMLCDDISKILDPSCKIDHISLFSDISKIFSFSINVYNNIFKYS
ncbi:nucleotidyltransferase, putative [Plasmodium relictum]|uniref:Nucleotidyltransferase, putative n=1 Tax=Plasmodium relictum TaxID=85471 RepID=A0A1J1HAX5_PLARL|nr:nucleotidyltransferase, putative [Plasmodium relictum]CRH01751.1 nucleotidyltransferase, putative [Plasmodium relictum]